MSVRTARVRALLMVALAAMVSAAAAQPQKSGHRVSSLEIKILSTMLADEGFGEWGFAALVEADGRRILFDTGANDDTVQRNLKVLGLDLSNVDVVILSHNHADHTTGLMPLRRQAMAASPRALSQAYVGQGIFWPRIAADGTVDDRMAGIRTAFEATGGRVTEVAGPTEIFPGVWLTGPVPRIHPEHNWGALGKVRRNGRDLEDTVPEDMALVFQTDGGLVELFGCGHAGVVNTLDHVRKAIDPGPVKAVIGGLHLFLNDDKALTWTAAQLTRFRLQQLVGAHCTGLEAVFRIRELAKLTRQACVVGAVGASYSLADGINPLRVAK